MRLVKVEDLKPGDVIDVWYHEPGPNSEVEKVEIVQRPGYRYNAVRITLKDGNVFRDVLSGQLPLVGQRLTVVK